MFSRMTHEDKLAFFELLDEYFESRPHIFSRESENGGVASQPAAVAANAVHRTMAANPQATADVVSTGLKSIPKGSQYSAASNPVIANMAGRFAASSIASSYGGGAKSPPAPPRRNVGTTDDSPSPSRTGPAGLLGSKRFGDVDTSSITAAFTSSFKGGKPAPAPASSTLPPALDNGSRRNFAPPPVRRVPTNTSSEGDAGAEPKNNRGNQNQGPVRRVPSHNTLQRQPTPEPEHAQGEPAEALYDYNSSAAEDINVRQGDRFIVVERTSDDWWTGEINGRRGLLPASYVRLL
ncbi:hypothetical protein RSAG8_00347, partial [Rhizoctonia solani AG-8 WAC10335]